MMTLFPKSKFVAKNNHAIRGGGAAGFTMIELMVSVGMFIVIGAGVQPVQAARTTLNLTGAVFTRNVLS